MTDKETMQQRIELKPCPFCGDKAYVGNAKNKDGAVLWFGECDECCCGTDNYKSEAEAIAAWNRRSEHFASAPSEPRWIEVKDRLPKSMESVLLLIHVCAPFIRIGWFSEACYEWFTDHSTFSFNAVSHWMPLPDAPSRESSAPSEPTFSDVTCQVTRIVKCNLLAGHTDQHHASSTEWRVPSRESAAGREK